jgi:hypothetical protein
MTRIAKRICGLIGLLVLVCSATSAFAESKLAFVVGIDAYPHLAAEAQLERAVADANAVGDTLHSLGFEVTRVTNDQTLEAILDAFQKFKSRIGIGDTVVFYYAGHGISLDDGNYLIPADVPLLGPNDEQLAKHWTISETEFSQGLRDTGASATVVVIDACRNNPFPPKGTRSLGISTRGLARINPSPGIFTLYSAREGQAAIDRLPGGNDHDKNSLFTRVFIKALATPGVSLSELGDGVRDQVAQLAKENGQDQVPAIYNDLVGSRTVFLAGSATSAPKNGGQRVSGGERLEFALLTSDPVKAVGAALHGYGSDNGIYLVEKDVTFPGDIETVTAAFDESGRPVLRVHLASAGTDRINNVAIERKLALVLDGRTVLSSATVMAPLGSDVELSGNFSIDDIKRLSEAIAPSTP